MAFLKKIILLFLISSFGIGIQAQQNDIYFLIKKNFSIFSKTYENVALEYVDEVDPEQLMRIGLDAMMETLDPYTVIYDESQNEQAEILQRGNYAGIGIEAGYRDGKVVIVAPTEGGPAEKSGIRAGDEIIAIGGISTEGLQPEEVQSLTLGEAGTEVVIAIQRFGVNQTLEFELTRERIEVKNVSHVTHLGTQEDIGYIKLSQFGLRSAEEIRNSMIQLQEDKELNGLILDLRDNPGGILQEAVGIIDKFVDPGLMVVENRGRLREHNQTFTTREPIAFQKPVVVLVNGGSASASEVVSGALQDLDRAVIVGEQSFGKGLVQIVKQLPYNTSMKITIARYYIPSGRSIQSVQYTHEGRGTSVITSEETSGVFKTKNGRIVQEGRGIEPDVVVEIEKPTLLEIALLRKGVLFDFATEYYAQNENMSFDSIPDGLFNDFKNYLEQSEFEFDSETEEYLDVIENDLKSVDGITEKVDELRELVEQNEKQELENSREFIEKTLWLELVSRRKGSTSESNASLTRDQQVQAAIDLINNPDRIESILTGEN